MKSRTIVLVLAVASLGWSGNHRPQNHSQTVWNVFSFPTTNGGGGMGLSLSAKF